MGDEDRGMGSTGLGDRGLTPTEYEGLGARRQVLYALGTWILEDGMVQGLRNGDTDQVYIWDALCTCIHPELPVYL